MMRPDDPLADVIAPSLMAGLASPWGLAGLNAIHREAIDGALARRDGLLALDRAAAVVCGQIGAFARRGLTLIAVPSDAVAEERVRAIAGVPVGAAAIFDAAERDTLEDLRRRVRRGEIRMLYVPPRALMGEAGPSPRAAVALVSALSATQLVIEDAHRLSPLSVEHDPVYARVATFRAAFPWVFVRAFTDTDSAPVRDDVVRLLGLREPQRLLDGGLRPNLTLRAEPRHRLGTRQLRSAVIARPGQAGLICCGPSEEPRALASRLVRDGVAASPWEPGGSPAASLLVVRHTDLGALPPRDDARFILHAASPPDLEAYRAHLRLVARDGLPGDALLLHAPTDPERSPPGAADEALARYVAGRVCRHALVAGWTGASLAAARCASCDVCRPELASQAAPDAPDGDCSSAPQRTAGHGWSTWLGSETSPSPDAPIDPEVGRRALAMFLDGLEPPAVAARLGVPVRQVAGHLVAAARLGRLGAEVVGGFEVRRVLAQRASLLGAELSVGPLRAVTPAELPDWQVALWCEAVLASGQSMGPGDEDLGARCQALLRSLRGPSPGLERKLRLTLAQPEESLAALSAYGLSVIGGEAACEALLSHPLASASQLVVAAVLRAIGELVARPELVDLRDEAVEVARAVAADDWAPRPLRALAERLASDAPHE